MNAQSHAFHPSVNRRQIELPLSKAFAISLRSIRIRFARSLITAAGILLGIAFFTSVEMSATFAHIRQQTMLEKRRLLAAGNALPMEDLRELTEWDQGVGQEAAAANRLKWLSVVALVVCTVGITNAMLMSVTERYKEIGTMKCLGALDSFIVKLFFIESCMLGFISSVAGFLAGWFLLSIAHLLGDGARVLGAEYWNDSVRLAAFSILLGTALTFVATIPPAYRAARMPAALALRAEI